MSKIYLIFSSKKDASKFSAAVNDAKIKDKFVAESKDEPAPDLTSRMRSAASVFGGILGRGGVKANEKKVAIETLEEGSRVEIKEGPNSAGTILEVVSHLQQKGLLLEDLTCEVKGTSEEVMSIESAFDMVKSAYLRAKQRPQAPSDIPSGKTDVESVSSRPSSEKSPGERSPESSPVQQRPVVEETKPVVSEEKSQMPHASESSPVQQRPVVEETKPVVSEEKPQAPHVATKKPFATPPAKPPKPVSVQPPVHQEKEERELTFAEKKALAQATLLAGQKPIPKKPEGSASIPLASLPSRPKMNRNSMRMSSHSNQEGTTFDDSGVLAPITISWNSKDLKELKNFKMALSSNLKDYMETPEVKEPTCVILKKESMDDEIDVDEAFVYTADKVFYVNRAEGIRDELSISPEQLAESVALEPGRILTPDDLDTIRSETKYLRPDDKATFQITIDKKVGPDVFYDALNAVKRILGGGFPPKLVDLSKVTFNSSDKNSQTNPLARHFETALSSHLQSKARPSIAAESDVPKQEAPKVVAKPTAAPKAGGGLSLAAVERGLAGLKKATRSENSKPQEEKPMSELEKRLAKFKQKSAPDADGAEPTKGPR